VSREHLPEAIDAPGPALLVKDLNSWLKRNAKFEICAKRFRNDYGHQVWHR